MRTIDCGPLMDFPQSVVYRFIERIECQQGKLGLAVDVTSLPRVGDYGAFSVEVKYYLPATSGGYHKLYSEGELLIVNQVNSIIQEVMLKLINQVRGADHVSGNMFIVNKGIHQAAAWLGFELEKD